MSIQKTTTELETLKINYLTQEMYEDALENDEINSNELYISSDTPNYVIDINWSSLFASSTVTPNSISSGYYYYSDGNITAMDFPDYLRVVFNGTTYTCEKQVYDETTVWYGGENSNNHPFSTPSANSIDFTDYPFSIGIVGTAANNNKLWQIWVEDGDSFTLQIDRGYETITVSSDFEQAVLYVLNGGNN